MSADAKTPGQLAVGLVTRYQDAVLEMLRKTIALVPAAERPTFVRDVVQADPAIAALGHRLRSLDLAGSARPLDRSVQEPHE